MLLVLAGRSGVGKTTIARLLARELHAAWLRIDTIEQALHSAGMADVGAAGYVAAYRLAADQLRLGLPVVADAVNPLRCNRAAWSGVAAEAGMRCVFVEVVCSDPVEHRRRIEARAPDIEGHVLPTWDAVLARRHEPMEEERVVIDTACMTPQAAVALIVSHSAMRPAG